MSNKLNNGMAVIKAMDQVRKLTRELEVFQKLADQIRDEVDPAVLTKQWRADYGLIMQLSNYSEDALRLAEYYLDNDFREGELVKQSNGRYVLDTGGLELTSGAMLQYKDNETGVFYTSSLEHSGDDYYIVGLGKKQAIEGVTVRVRY